VPGVFISATGTEVGKTYLSAGLIRACRRAGRPVRAFKPVISGFDEGDPDNSDTALLLAALGEPVTDDTIAAVSPWRFLAPLSPDQAARLEARTVSFDEVAAACRAQIVPKALTVIEGVGGVMVPLTAARTTLDLMVVLDIPILLVTPTTLGCISHLLTAIEALKGRGLEPTMIVLSESPESTVPLDMLLETLGTFCSPNRLAVLRRSDEEQAMVFDSLLARVTSAAGD
jgi:dethiobiotin synthetase